jgi:branched-chain amino acid transport system ATP-binding protein
MAPVRQSAATQSATPPDAPVLVTHGLSKRFGGLHAVRDVSIALRAGELHCVIGPNGAGKSTLTNLLSGELAPSSGTIQLDGRDVSAEPVWRRAALGIGRSYQRTNIFPSLAVLENVRLAAQARSAGSLAGDARLRRDLVDKAAEALARVGLSWAHARQANALSHGAQRQLEIAMALATGPKVLLLDEPLAGMGSEEGVEMAELIRKLAADHAVLLIEHDMDAVFRVADILTVMVDGAVLATGSPPEIRTNAHVQRAYLGGHA